MKALLEKLKLAADIFAETKDPGPLQKAAIEWAMRPSLTRKFCSIDTERCLDHARRRTLAWILAQSLGVDYVGKMLHRGNVRAPGRTREAKMLVKSFELNVAVLPCAIHRMPPSSREPWQARLLAANALPTMPIHLSDVTLPPADWPAEHRLRDPRGKIVAMGKR